MYAYCTIESGNKPGFYCTFNRDYGCFDCTTTEITKSYFCMHYNRGLLTLFFACTTTEPTKRLFIPCITLWDKKIVSSVIVQLQKKHLGDLIRRCCFLDLEDIFMVTLFPLHNCLIYSKYQHSNKYVTCEKNVTYLMINLN